MMDDSTARETAMRDIQEALVYLEEAVSDIEWQPQDDTLVMKLHRLNKCFEEAKARAYSPNVWTCDACNFQVVKAILYTEGGGVSLDTRDTDERCPNDGFLLRRLTWEELANARGMAALRLSEESARFREAIQKHRAQRSDDRCWEDDQELYSALQDGDLGDNRVGDKDAMLRNCARFLEQRCTAGGWKTYAELEKEIASLQILVAWEGSEISEGQVAKTLETDRVSVREMRSAAVLVGIKLVEAKKAELP